MALRSCQLTRLLNVRTFDDIGELAGWDVRYAEIACMNMVARRQTQHGGNAGRCCCPCVFLTSASVFSAARKLQIEAEGVSQSEKKELGSYASLAYEPSLGHNKAT